MLPSSTFPSGDEIPKPDPQALLELLKWHLERYDRLRASTVSRASVVLSAGAILSTGDAVILARLLGATRSDIGGWPRALVGAGLVASAILVVIVLLRASGVLVALRSSRSLFPGDVDLPSAFLYNGRDTLDQAAAFPDFRTAISAENYAKMIESAQVELWIVIQQHRRRYIRLRGAVLLLNLSAIIFLISFIGLAIVVVTA